MVSPEFEAPHDEFDEQIRRLDRLSFSQRSLQHAVHDTFEFALDYAVESIAPHIDISDDENKELALELTFSKLKQRMPDSLKQRFANSAIDLLDRYNPDRPDIDHLSPEFRAVIDNREIIRMAISNRFQAELQVNDA